MATETATFRPPTPRERRADLAKRIDLAREILAPVVVRENPEARVARAAWHLLGDAARELVEECDDG
jgi:hypothetical protein